MQRYGILRIYWDPIAKILFCSSPPNLSHSLLQRALWRCARLNYYRLPPCHGWVRHCKPQLPHCWLHCKEVNSINCFESHTFSQPRSIPSVYGIAQESNRNTERQPSGTPPHNHHMTYLGLDPVLSDALLCYSH
ncbi:hypothetical protein SCLCIDRAFT_587212 [Scleroderma citrinum Foug A]|uniref:Uncharacterized protein n=1 Tax=Scleroderma citrinum Foug A TaxID=1036808 RepID=A0A0C3CU17_9AGAM|nr:hypothetical protein SCLCIDRAFT_587212 [Scleroderma citrinum Foug A]